MIFAAKFQNFSKSISHMKSLQISDIGTGETSSQTGKTGILQKGFEWRLIMGYNSFSIPVTHTSFSPYSETPLPPRLTSVQAVSMTSVNMTWEAAAQDENNQVTYWVIQARERYSKSSEMPLFLLFQDFILFSDLSVKF